MKLNKIISYVILLLSLSAVCGSLFLGWYFYKGKIEQEETYSEILMDEAVDVYSGEPYILTPYLKKADGSIEAGNFMFESSDSAVRVDEVGKITLNSAVNHEVYITITERNEGISTKVRVNIIYDLFELKYITESENAVPADITRQMVYRNTYKYYCKTLPLEADVKDYTEYSVYDRAGNIINGAVFGYTVQNNVLSFTAVGIGEGLLEIRVFCEEKDIDFTARFPFRIQLMDEQLTKDILNYKNKTLLSDDDIKKTEVLEATGNELNFSGLEGFTSLRKMVLTAEEVVQLANERILKITYRVPGQLLNAYLQSETWKDLQQNIIPFEDDPEAVYAVCHSPLRAEAWYEKITYGYTLPTPKEEGYTFRFWQDIAGNPVEAVNPEDGLHIYAQWTENTYTVNYVVSASGEKLPSVQAAYTESITVPELSDPVVGYRFIGWSKTRYEGGKAEDEKQCDYFSGKDYSKIASQGTVDLYDMWIAVEYMITYQMDGGSLDTEKVTDSFTVNDSFSLPIPQKTGYKFIGWYRDSSFSTSITELAEGTAEDMEVWALWQAKSFEIYFQDTEYISKKTVVFNEPYGELPQLSQEGHEFSGWFMAPEGGTKILEDTVVKTPYNHVLYARWDTLSYMVRLDENWSDGAESVMVVYYGNTYGMLPQPERYGYEFKGWFTEKTGGTEIYSDTVVSITDNQTLYAQWKAISSIVVHFDANGGKAVSNKIVTYNERYGELQSTSKEGNEFKGWFTEISGGTQVTTDTVVKLAENHTLYAHWTPNPYSVTLNFNGGNEPTTSITVVFGEKYGNLSTGTRTGYIFAGWFTAKTGGVLVTENTTVEKAYNHTLYAHWTPRSYKITQTATNASISWSPSGEWQNYDTKITFTIKYSQDDNRHFYVNGSDMGGITSYTMTITGNVEVSAKSESSCFAEGTMILMADGSYEAVENLKTGDMIMTWDFFTGKISASPIALYWNHGTEEYRILNLMFTNGSHVKVITSHGFYDRTLNTFVFLDYENYLSYIGHEFIVYDDNDSCKAVVLESAYITFETVGCYSVLTAGTGNAYIENMLSLTVEPISGVLVLFDITDEMRYDSLQMQEDIEAYGLYTYDEWSEYMTKQAFDALNGQYFKILVGKGIISEEDILSLLQSQVYPAGV